MTTLTLPPNLKAELRERGLTLTALADAVGTSRTWISMAVNHGLVPQPELAARISGWLAAKGIQHTPQKKTPKRSNAPGSVPSAETTQPQENDMLLRKTPISRAAREHFGLNCDPFRDVAEPDDVLLTPDFRYVREAMLDKIKFGGFLGVVGESGSGKTTLREALIDHLGTAQRNVIVIQPYMLASETQDKHGKTLKALHIAEAVMAAVAPTAKILSSPEVRFRQLHQALVESGRSGMRHVLIIEEAHSVPVPTLKHLKRFLELKDGLRPLLSVILIGQPELADKLAEGSPEVREVVQRIELVTLTPLDTQLDAYLTHRLALAGVPLARVIDTAGLDALRALLGPSRKNGLSRTYPLMVHNVLARAMNAAADLGAPRVTADFLKGV